MGDQTEKRFYTYLQSQQTAQQYLNDCYKNINGINATFKSFENSQSFIHYLDHGVRFYENGKRMETLLQPMLFFYGMVHLLKGALLTVRPNYPESTAVLAHGVSSRKRKKKDYTFLNDEVKIQHHGLYPYFTHYLFAIKESPFEKIKMERLLSLIPEMTSLFKFNRQDKMAAIGRIGTTQIAFPGSILDGYHLTANAFIKRIKPYLPAIQRSEISESSITLDLDAPFKPAHNSPFFTASASSDIYFPMHRENFFPISEIMVHYLLLYNLSMLCRYESEWWGELLTAKPDADYPFINAFLNITCEKIPILVENLLLQKY
ncbi:YaaC-like Protein [Lentibacillus persicus]|uniref:YaaC-like Protein n=1 Tax=Lentibacillus persicus TaxID=640948 RepID=A0A1I1ULC6_9BACI|nr:YaaC family protein [Lentibacillus persicus]SFD71611.1 YaaC-like Protein [Lentibacillus persicus]